MAERRSSLSGRIISVFILVILLVIAPITIFIYSYGDTLTNENLLDQLEVSMSDNKIRFQASMESYEVVLKEIATSPLVVSALSSKDENSQVALNAIIKAKTDGLEDDIVVYVTSLDKTISAATDEAALAFYKDIELGDYIHKDDIHYDTRIRYSVGSMRVVLNMQCRVYDAAGRVVGYVVVDVFGDQFVHFADPALVNAVTLYNTQTGKITSLTFLDVYGDYTNTAPFMYISPPEGEEMSTSLSDGRLLSFYKLDKMPFYIVGVLDVTPYKNSLEQFYTLLIVLIVACVFISVGISVLLAKTIVDPIRKLSYAMNKVEKGNLQVRVVNSNIQEMSDLEDKFNEMINEINYLMMKNSEESAKVAEAERKALEAQLNPHFLFNTLNVIRSIARTHKEKQIEDITIRLGRLLRYAVDNHDPIETLDNSFQMVNSYLDIQKVRFGEKLVTRLHIDESIKEVKTPKLIIQPLVENAIVHGLDSKVGEWFISVDIRDMGEEVEITVQDNGVGFDTSGFDMEALSVKGNTGMYNVYKRMRLYYREKSDFLIKSKVGEGTSIQLRFPKDKG